MSLPDVVIFSGLLTAWIGLGARASVECDVLDVLLLSGACIGIGYLLPRVFA